MALGNYENGRFEVPGLGLCLAYDAGTVIAMSGKLFRHRSHCESNRACIAYYMRDNVLARMVPDEEQPDFVNISRFL